MVEVNGTPILGYQLGWLAAAGVEHVVIAAGYRGEAIVEYVASLSLSSQIRVLVEDRPLGRGGALKLAARYLPCGTEPWLAVYGDIWTSFSLEEMTAFHRGHGLIATLAMVRSHHPRPMVVRDQSSRIARLEPAPATPHWVNAGVYLFSPGLAVLLPAEGDHDHTFTQLIEIGQFAGYPVEAYWRAINTPIDLHRIIAEKHVSSRVELGGDPR